MMQRKRFFSGDGPQDMPLLPSSSHSSTSLARPRSPPSSSLSFDFSRLVPGRASSMSLVRQKSGGRLSLSPQLSSQNLVTSLFPSHSDSNLSSQGSYGMLNPGPSSSYHSHSRSSNAGWACNAVAVAGLVVLAFLSVSSYNHNGLLRQELYFKDAEIHMHLDHAHALERRVSQMRSETVHLYDRLEELEHPPQTQEEMNIQRKVFHLEHFHEQVHQGIQENSRRVLREKFGPGPNYYVEMKLDFDPESNVIQDATTVISDTIVFETASIEDMPHAVQLFLEQVEYGLYNGASFYRNTPNRVQAGFQKNQHLTERLNEEPSLGSVLFQEYSPQMTHRQYTLGYPGRPGGPDFYVNMLDNTEVHGPGGQIHHSSDVMADADPCFARVIRGFNTMERIHRSKVNDDEQFRNEHAKHTMIHPILIRSMRILHDYHGQGAGSAVKI